MFDQIFTLDNTIQNYAWGSLTAIPALLGQPSSGTPQAEVWMGAHPKAPSGIELDGKMVPLDEAIARSPDAILGEKTARTFAGRLPFLFKILAAATPLSIQAHPDRHQARQGFEAENAAGVPLGAPHRNYRDDNHKPECICALTPFWGLCGFRDIPVISRNLEQLCPRTLGAEIGMLRQDRPESALRKFYRSLLTCSKEKQRAVLEEVLRRVAHRSNEDPVFRWIAALHQSYPGDISVISPAFLNLFCLEPGQALFLPAGELHAYLDGMGIELMANSDNVLRGGLTSKHIDVEELLKILHAEPRRIEILTPVAVSEYEKVYMTDTQEFMLSVISPVNLPEGIEMRAGGVQILLCTEGVVRIHLPQTGQWTTLAKGSSVLVPARIDRYFLYGEGKIFKAAVPGNYSG